tara:strand:+ start:618 stop:914 length:297 start_codon:yes stop_codon:yes gene_type:complete
LLLQQFLNIGQERNPQGLLQSAQMVLDDVVADVNTTKESETDFYYRCTNVSDADYSMDNTFYAAIRPTSFAAFGVYEHGSPFYAFYGKSRLDRAAETL